MKNGVMKITIQPPALKLPLLKQLKVGSCFVFEERHFLKIHSDSTGNVFSLFDNRVEAISVNAVVRPMDAELILK